MIVTSMGKTGQKVGTREISQCDLVMNRESLVSHVKHRRNEGAGSKHPKKNKSKKYHPSEKILHKNKQVYRTVKTHLKPTSFKTIQPKCSEIMSQNHDVHTHTHKKQVAVSTPPPLY